MTSSVLFRFVFLVLSLWCGWGAKDLMGFFLFAPTITISFKMYTKSIATPPCLLKKIIWTKTNRFVYVVMCEKSSMVIITIKLYNVAFMTQYIEFVLVLLQH